MSVEKDKKTIKSNIQKEKNYKKIPNKINQQKKGMAFLNVKKNKLEEKKNKTLISNINKKKNNSRQKRDKSKKEEKKNNTNTNFYHGISLFSNYMNSPYNTKNKNNNNLNIEKDKRKIIKCRQRN